MIRYLFLAVLLLILLIIAEIYREQHTFRITHYCLTTKKQVQSCRYVFLSDLHNQIYGTENEALLQAIAHEEPDCILIGGDMLVGKNGHSFETAKMFVQQLTSLCPVYYANGNHEQRLKTYPGRYDISYAEYQNALIDAGVCFLENSSVTLNSGAVLTGLEIPISCYTHFRKQEMPHRAVEERIGKCDSSRYQILMAHTPTYVKEYLAWGADLILCGHLHGGMVRIPGVGGVIAPNFTLFPKYSGEMSHVGEQTIIVSKGLGTHTIPIRLLNTAEVIVIDLKMNES